MNANPLRVLIVGCGNIAGRFDESRSQSDFPLTHAGALSRDHRFSLVACVDPDTHRLNEFAEAWGIPAGFESMKQLLDLDVSFDVISICSPTSCHIHDIEVALRLSPKLIFCEKPVTKSLLETERLVAECSKAKILLAVNYSRRWDPDITKLKNDIQAGYWGQLRSVVGVYNKGILNNGSHMLDIINFLLGPLTIKNVGVPIDDFFQSDPTIPVWLEAANGLPMQLVCGHAKDYAIFEIQFLFSQGVLTMEEGGMFWRERRAKDSTTFKGYRVLDDGSRRAGKYPRAMLQAVDNIYHAINQDRPLASTGESALVAQRICEQIKQQAFEGR